MLDKITTFFTSLRLTVVCLTMAMVLVFIGTLAQVELGLYTAQEKYFQSFLVYWTPKGTDWNIPVWPGGYLLGWVLLINLIASHFKRFTLTKRKIGIFLTHAGLILLLLGQFLTELFQVESFMRLDEGEEKNYSEDGRRNELAVVDITDANQDKVIAFPDSMLEAKGELKHPELPFTLKVHQLLPNSIPDLDPAADASTVSGTQGVGSRLKFKPRPTTASMNDENKPSAAIEVVGEGGSLGTWALSTWLTKHPWSGVVAQELGPTMVRPQTFTYKDRTYQIALRPIRYYKPFSIRLLDFTHDRYKGTEIPKNFSSKVHLTNPSNGESREVLIYMNNPLRYGGETYYQGGFEKGDKTSILQVVRNPAWLTPYFSCTLVGAGLVVQFLMHLFGFAKKSSSQQGKRAGVPNQTRSGDRELQLAGVSREPSGSAQVSKKRKS